MRTIKTVLVLGAGASCEFGLPLGSGLRKKIAEDLNLMFDGEWGQRLESGSSEITDALRLLVRHEDGRNGDINPHRHAAVQISGSMRLSSSIDEYIERHKGDALKVECAKLAIAKAILEAERASTIYADPHGRSDPFENASESWLGYMLRDLTRGLAKSALKSAFENLTIINFNYDRCVEHYAYLWFQRLYDLSESESAEVCNQIKIFHPYTPGFLGRTIACESSLASLISQQPISRKPLRSSLSVVSLGFGNRTNPQSRPSRIIPTTTRLKPAMNVSAKTTTTLVQVHIEVQHNTSSCSSRLRVKKPFRLIPRPRTEAHSELVEGHETP